MAMIRPSGSFPLYTLAHPPWPILDASEKLAVILFSSAIVKINEPKGLSNDVLDEEAPYWPWPVDVSDDVLSEVAEKSLATLCLCSLDHRRRPRKQDIEKKNESDADQLATDWWWWWCWFLQILGVLLLLVSLVMLDATGILYFSLATVLLTSFLLDKRWQEYWWNTT